MAEHTEAPKTEFLLYQTEDGQNRIEVRFEGDTAWLSQKLLSDLYQVTVPAINQHIKAIYEDQELVPEATVKKYLIVRREGSRQIRRAVDSTYLPASGPLPSATEGDFGGGCV